jgi:ribonucleoside-diphosphate reductase alpha chain
MRDMIGGNKEKRAIWGKILKRRNEDGYPYIIFSDTINNNAPDIYRKNGMRIHCSNVCTEIALPSSQDESFVCDLSSLNLAHWEDIVQTDAVETLTMFLDAVMTDFIIKTDGMPFMEAPRRFAIRHRALGLGVLGWHTFLQKKRIPFESMEAKIWNTKIHKEIRARAEEASTKLAQMFGEPELLSGAGRRNSTLLAVAPTLSSSFILGGGLTSPSIEPWDANYFVPDLAKGKFTVKNDELKKALEGHGKNTPETWKSILIHGGSVQHLDFLSDNERDVFKTFGEISQKEVVIQAAARQKYIDQGQSLNLMIGPKIKAKEKSDLLIFGWEQGIKSFYYQKGANPAQELARSLLTCQSCEG